MIIWMIMDSHNGQGWWFDKDGQMMVRLRKDSYFKVTNVKTLMWVWGVLFIRKETQDINTKS